MRNYANEYAWKKEKYGRLEATIDKEKVNNFKEYLKINKISFSAWVSKKIDEELNTTNSQ